MTREKVNNTLQWAGATFVILGQVLNAFGNMDPYNIMAFTVGSVLFITWAFRVSNKPQVLVNFVSIAACIGGLVRAFV